MQVNHTMEQRSKALFTAAPWKDARGRRELRIASARLVSFAPFFFLPHERPLFWAWGKGYLDDQDLNQQTVSTVTRARSRRV